MWFVIFFSALYGEQSGWQANVFAPLTAPGDVGEFAVEVFETPVCGRCHAEDGEETGDDSAGNAASGSDGCEDLRLGKTMRRMKALEAGGQPKGGRKSVARRSKRQRHGVVKDVAEGLKIQEGVHVCQDIQSDMAVNPPHTDGSKDGTSNPPNPPTKDRPHKSVSTTIRHPALEFRVQSPQRRHPSLRRDTPVPYISIFDPLNTPAFKPVSKSKKPPRWMSRKPSSIAGALQLAPRSQPVRPEDVSVLASHEVVVVVQQQLPEAIVKEAEQPPPTSSLIPKSSLQFQKSRRRSGGGGASSPHPLVVSFAASPPNPKTHQRVSPAARQKLKSRKATPIPPTFTRKELSSYPFFQNPRRPIVPAVESSWGNLSKLSPGLFPYGESAGGATSGSGEPVVVGGGKGRKGGGEIVMNRGVVLGQPRVISSFRSTEYLDKYRDRDGGGGKGESTTSTNPTLTHTCPCCSGTISPSIPPSIPSTIKASNGHHYHLPCFTCRICRKPIDTAKGKLDDYMFLMQIPHHRRCVAGEMIGKKKGARGNNKDASVALLKPRGDTPPDPPPPNPRAHKIAATTASPPKDHNALSSFFSVRKKPPIPPLPPLDPACAACGLPLLPPSDILLGPSETKVHKPCMRCRRCGDRMATTRWYEWDGKGLMVLLCRECWRRGRRERGYTVEEIGREEKGLLGG
ncbi:hypothetical protein FGG08_005480 [Glutinoglossum americanum]|uniref:LIM zinc-binding domain-containing protein n=1 Tax=Glutinoglossum americanum TaxID=1670608 RepID=A0A9P8L1T2_9PEZI|nr:hypothetical protein FGG08_005480 [Glutinoglossum americanum]